MKVCIWFTENTIKNKNIMSVQSHLTQLLINIIPISFLKYQIQSQSKFQYIVIEDPLSQYYVKKVLKHNYL